MVVSKHGMLISCKSVTALIVSNVSHKTRRETRLESNNKDLTLGQYISELKQNVKCFKQIFFGD